MFVESHTKESQKIVGVKRTHREMDQQTNSSNSCVESNSSSNISSSNACLNCSSSSSCSSSSGSCSGCSLILNSSSDTTWKTMYEDEHTKNTMLNLQLCFVQSECVRLLNLQSEMATSIATLQVSGRKFRITSPFLNQRPHSNRITFSEFFDQLD